MCVRVPMLLIFSNIEEALSLNKEMPRVSLEAELVFVGGWSLKSLQDRVSGSSVDMVRSGPLSCSFTCVCISR